MVTAYGLLPLVVLCLTWPAAAHADYTARVSDEHSKARYRLECVSPAGWTMAPGAHCGVWYHGDERFEYHYYHQALATPNSLGSWVVANIEAVRDCLGDMPLESMPAIAPPGPEWPLPRRAADLCLATLVPHATDETALTASIRQHRPKGSLVRRKRHVLTKPPPQRVETDP